MNTVAPLQAEPPGETQMETVALPRTAGLFALVALFSMALRNLCRVRRLFVVILLFSIPLALVILIRTLNPDGFAAGRSASFYRLELIVVFNFMPHVLLPLTALLFAAGIIQDEIEDQTLTYLLVRPLPKSGLYAVKLLAALFVAALLLTVFTTLTEAAVWFGSKAIGFAEWLQRTRDLIAAMLCALAAYAAIFGFFSLLFKRTLIIGAAYILLFEGIVANIPFVIREYTIMYYLRTLWLRWLSFPEETLKRLKQTWQIEMDLAPTASGAMTTLAVVAAVFLFLGCYLMATREFRLKTPEGN